MEVIKYIKEHGFDKLTEELGIKVKDYPEHNLVVLNYCQIDSPKTHPVVRECRGLILQKDTLQILCRPFDRFFNAGEAPETVEDFDITKAIAYEKIDGSLIKVWFNPMTNWWEIATRGTAFAESPVNGFDLTFRDLVHRAVGVSSHEEFDQHVRMHLCKNTSYMFEVTATENRVVRRYEGTQLWFLGAREIATGYDLTDSTDVCAQVSKLNVKFPEKFQFDTLDHALHASKQLKNLDEGYVLFDVESHKRIKVKSPAYVAVHHIRGEGLNPKRIKELVLTNEQDEYLQYFPEDTDLVTPYVLKLALLESNMVEAYEMHRGALDQKEFALGVKDFCFSGILFNARKENKEVVDIWANAPDNMKYKIFSNFVGE